MTAQTEPEIVLYDMAWTKNVCFSPVVWRIRLMLNYKRIPYRTIFLELLDIEPKLKALALIATKKSPNLKFSTGLVPGESASGCKYKYTFLESTYPDPSAPLTSELGREIEAKARDVVGTTFRTSEYFRRTREASLGHRLEDLLDLDKEEHSWNAVGDSMRTVCELMQTHRADVPFVLGARPSYTDFFIAGSLQSARVVDESVCQRIFKYPGYK
ncbi:hypothetical protein V1517DRAFT_321512 [Lipomyces orientalis]|uniref:Uncharacterized protein n=1 Tax=Lipomyces orientalis TaxID=1233043 RepID=A0ACC3TR42_9ASCO